MLALLMRSVQGFRAWWMLGSSTHFGIFIQKLLKPIPGGPISSSLVLGISDGGLIITWFLRDFEKLFRRRLFVLRYLVPIIVL
jgi:hypothetical protein